MGWTALKQQAIAAITYLVDLSARRKLTGDVVPIYLASRPVYFSDRQYLPVAMEMPSLSKKISDTLEPNSIPTWGELTISITPDFCPGPGNTISWSDFLTDYAFVSQTLTIRIGAIGFAEAEYITLFDGYVDSVNWTDEAVTFAIYDKTRELLAKVPDRELASTSYVIEENWGQIVKLVLGTVKNYEPVLIQSGLAGAFDLRYALACHVIENVTSVYINGALYDQQWWDFVQKDVSPATLDRSGSADIETSGPYTGSAVIRTWLLLIDSIASGSEVGKATFKWSIDGGTTWVEEGKLTWNLGNEDPVKDVAVGPGTMALAGTYTDQSNKREYSVRIVTSGNLATGTFQYSDDGEVSWSAETDILDGTPKSISHGLTVAFALASDTWDVTKTPSGTSLGTMTASGTYTGAVSEDYLIKIDGAGDVGTATFKWSKDGGSTWEATGVTATADVVLEAGIHCYFDNNSTPPPNAFDVDDEFEFDVVPAFVADDKWTWSFTELPIELENGVCIQFTTQSGQDFYVDDRFEFFLCSSLMAYSGGGSNAVTITVDANGLVSPVTGTFRRTIGALIQDLIVGFAKGWTATYFYTADIATLDAAWPYYIGIVVDSPMEITAIMDDLLAGYPMVYSYDLDGNFVIKVVEVPAGVSFLELTDVDSMQYPATMVSSPYRRVYINYERNWQGNSVDNQADVGRWEWLKKEWRSVSARYDVLRDTYPTAQDLGPIDTCLVDRTDAQSLANALLYRSRQETEQVTYYARHQAFDLEIGKLVSISRDVFGLESNPGFMTVGVELDLGTGESILTLWRIRPSE